MISCHPDYPMYQALPLYMKDSEFAGVQCVIPKLHYILNERDVQYWPPVCGRIYSSIDNPTPPNKTSLSPNFCEYFHDFGATARWNVKTSARMNPLPDSSSFNARQVDGLVHVTPINYSGSYPSATTSIDFRKSSLGQVNRETVIKSDSVTGTTDVFAYAVIRCYESGPALYEGFGKPKRLMLYTDVYSLEMDAFKCERMATVRNAGQMQEYYVVKGFKRLSVPWRTLYAPHIELDNFAHDSYTVLEMELVHYGWCVKNSNL